MNVLKAIKNRRTIRKFKRKKVSPEDLDDLVGGALLAPSAMNRQPLEFLIVDEEKLERKIFTLANWGGSVDWSPSLEERPPAYVIILVNKDIAASYYKYDVGLAAENICLGAVEKDLGTCILGSAKTEPLRDILNIPGNLEINLVVAIGHPDQRSMIADWAGSKDYWIDGQGTVHVPKREKAKLIHRNRM